MSFEEEAAILSPFIERAERWEMVDIKEIVAAYQKAVPHKISRSTLYSIGTAGEKSCPDPDIRKKQVRRL